MADYQELKRLAEAANAVLGDVAIEMTISGERGPNQSEINAVAAFTGAANPAAVLALIAEIERVTSQSQRLRAGVDEDLAEIDRIQAAYDELFRSKRNYRMQRDQAKDERDQLKAEVEALRKERAKLAEDKRGLLEDFGGLL
jgi:chromosome segregation ATPase